MTKFFIFPYGETFKQISAIGEFWRKECSNSIQCQCFSKSSWAGDQGEAIVAFPPFFDEMRFINIEEIVFPKKGKALFACRNRTWHDVLRFRGRCRLWMGLLGLVAVLRLLLGVPYHGLPALGNARKDAAQDAGRTRTCRQETAKGRGSRRFLRPLRRQDRLPA